MHILWVCMYIYIYLYIYVVFGQQRLARECLNECLNECGQFSMNSDARARGWGKGGDGAEGRGLVIGRRVLLIGGRVLVNR